MFEKLIEKLTCPHPWETFDKVNVYGSNVRGLPTYVIYILKCPKCGKIKKIKV